MNSLVTTNSKKLAPKHFHGQLGGILLDLRADAVVLISKCLRGLGAGLGIEPDNKGKFRPG